MPGTRICFAPMACKAVTIATISLTAWSAVEVVSPLVAKSFIPPQTTTSELLTRPGGNEFIVALNEVVIPGRLSYPRVLVVPLSRTSPTPVVAPPQASSTSGTCRQDDKRSIATGPLEYRPFQYGGWGMPRSANRLPLSEKLSP